MGAATRCDVKMSELERIRKKKRFQRKQSHTNTYQNSDTRGTVDLVFDVIIVLLVVLAGFVTEQLQVLVVALGYA